MDEHRRANIQSRVEQAQNELDDVLDNLDDPGRIWQSLAAVNREIATIESILDGAGYPPPST